MGLREIKAALRYLENEVNEEAAKRLILAVPFKRGRASEASGYAYDRGEMIARIARGRGESKAEVSKMVAGWQPGILIKAADAGMAAGGGPLVLITEGQYEQAGKTVYPRPDELRWEKAQIVYENWELGDIELFPISRWEEAVDHILRWDLIFFGE